VSERVHRDDDAERDGSSRAAVIRPRQVDSDRDTPRGVAGILALQQAAGNEAVGSLLAESAPVQREPADAPAAAPAVQAPHPRLLEGATGSAVKELQQKLGLAVAEAKLEVSGRFDWRTDEVVKRFQVQARLRPDGIVGPDTWGALDSVMGGTELAGDTLSRVQAVAEEAGVLYDAGDFSGALAKYMGLYGDPSLAHKTGGSTGVLVYDIAQCHHRLNHFAEAISFYEEAMTLPGIGAARAGSAAENLRRARLQQPFLPWKELEAGRAAYDGGASAEAHPQLSAGSRGAAVGELQGKLNSSVDEAKLEVSGRFDSHTEEVVKRFQVQSGLRPDGTVGPDTWGALDSVMGGTALTGETASRVSAAAREAEDLYDKGDYQGALDKFMGVYADSAVGHKARRGGLVYDIAECHHRLNHFAEAISFYEEVMSLPGGETAMAGSAAENVRRARLGEPFQGEKEMQAERAAFAP
jgi:peptidoglycan hydrolase-like protein with peptidoglycan-binding domain